MLGNQNQYLDQLIEFVDDRIKVWQSSIGDSIVKEGGKKVFNSAFSTSEISKNHIMMTEIK